MPKKPIVPPIADMKHCKTHFHNFTQVAMNQLCATAPMAVSQAVRKPLLSAPP